MFASTSRRWQTLRPLLSCSLAGPLHFRVLEGPLHERTRGMAMTWDGIERDEDFLAMAFKA